MGRGKSLSISPSRRKEEEKADLRRKKEFQLLLLTRELTSISEKENKGEKEPYCSGEERKKSKAIYC